MTKADHDVSEELKALHEFRLEIASWLEANIPADPGFLLPGSFMEVGTDRSTQLTLPMGFT